MSALDIIGGAFFIFFTCKKLHKKFNVFIFALTVWQKRLPSVILRKKY